MLFRSLATSRRVLGWKRGLIRCLRQAFYSLPNQIGVTATLDLKYRKPTFANQYLVIRTETVDVKGRKVWVKGHIETLAGERLVEAE